MELENKFNGETRGLLIRVHRGVTAHVMNQVKITFPSRWSTVLERKITCSLKFILIGHCYAREAVSFEVGESLDILGQEYLKGGLGAVQAAIGGGIFGLFIIDSQISRLSVISDLLACMPVYFRRHRQGIDIGTSEFDLGGEDIEPSACYEYLKFGHLMFAPAFHRGIERLGPGQTLEVDLKDGSVAALAEESYPVYPHPNERIRNLDEACRVLDQALSRFFGRMGDERLAVGLSGGYDSRLIAAYTRSHHPDVVTFDNPGTKETAYAQMVAEALGTTTRVVNISADAPSRLIEDFLFGMQSMDNLECSHVFALLEALMAEKPTYLIDGLLGDTAIGCGFFYKLHGKLNPAWRVLLLQDRYDLAINPDYDWIDHVYQQHPRRLPDEAMQVLGPAAKEYHFKQTAAMVNRAIRKACHTHFDAIDMINYRARTSRYFACGPVTFLRKCPTLCPYYDVDVLAACRSIDTSLRAGERLYNAFWRYRFPELASVPKESTGGWATQSDMRYRLAHFNSAVSRRLSDRFGNWLGGSAKAGGDLGDLISLYLGNVSNIALFDRINSKCSDLLAPLGLERVLSQPPTAAAEKRLYFRAISLTTLLSPPSQLGF